MFSNGIESEVSRLAVVLVLVAIGVGCAAALTPSDLRCEWRVNNQAVGDICPEFYWETEAQRACQVLVATSEDKLAPGQADAWDSGKVATRLPIVEYAGEPLANETTYHWKVRLWGEEGEPGPWSQVQRFTTKFEPLPSLRPHMRYFLTVGGGLDPELLASRYDLSWERTNASINWGTPEPKQFRPEYIALGYYLMATMVVPTDPPKDARWPKYRKLGAWCTEQGLGDGEVPEEMFCHFRLDTPVTLHVGAERITNPRETRTIPGWDPGNDRNGDGEVDDEEFANLDNPEAHAREMKQARIPMYYWGPPFDDYVMNIGHPDYQRFLAERYMPQQMAAGYDGVWVDTTPSDVPGAGGFADVLEYPRGPGEGDAYMRDMQIAAAKVKIALPDTLLTLNNWLANPLVADGMQRETWWLNITKGGSAFEASQKSAVQLDSRGKIQFLTYNPIFEPDRSPFGKKVPISLDRDAIFGLAGYYLVAGDYTYYGQGQHPWAEWYNAAADFNIGSPEGPYQKIMLQEAEAPEGDNLVANGDFEIDEDDDPGKPDGWIIAEPLELVEDVVKTGKRAVKIASDDVNINNMNKYFLTLKPHTAYTLSAWMKTEDLRGGLGAQIYVYDFEGVQGGGLNITLQGTNDWTHVTDTFTTADDTWGRVTFRVCGATGTVWFDDIQVVEGVFAESSVYVRRFSNALVVVRPSQPALGWGDETAIQYDLDGSYRPLLADSTLDEPLQQVNLRLGEAAILIPAR